MIRAVIAYALPLLLLGCGGAPFVAGEFAELPDSGSGDSAPPAIDSGSPASDAGRPAPTFDAGVDAPAPIEASTPDSGDALDSGAPPAADAGPPIDPVTYACGSKSADGPAPVATSLQWWASVSVPQMGDGGYTEDYCTPMSLGPGAATFPYTCEGVAAVWGCAQWQATGGSLGCHPSALDPSVLQVDCWIP